MLSMGREKEKIAHFFSTLYLKRFCLRSLKIYDYILVFGGRGSYLHQKKQNPKESFAINIKQPSK